MPVRLDAKAISPLPAKGVGAGVGVVVGKDVGVSVGMVGKGEGVLTSAATAAVLFSCVGKTVVLLGGRGALEMGWGVGELVVSGRREN